MTFAVRFILYSITFLRDIDTMDKYGNELILAELAIKCIYQNIMYYKV